VKTLFIALVALSASFAQADALTPAQKGLDASVLAQVITSGGFMAPGAYNTTTYSIKTNGDVIRITLRGRDFVTGIPTEKLIGRLDAQEQLRLERLSARIRPGALYDVNPNGPSGADAPNVSYQVNQSGKAVTVALRTGNLHIYALKQKSVALAIKTLLDKVIFRQR
jgi:hypothetical protein